VIFPKLGSRRSAARSRSLFSFALVRSNYFRCAHPRLRVSGPNHEKQKRPTPNKTGNTSKFSRSLLGLSITDRAVYFHLLRHSLRPPASPFSCSPRWLASHQPRPFGPWPSHRPTALCPPANAAKKPAMSSRCACPTRSVPPPQGHSDRDAFANHFEWEARYSDANERVRCDVPGVALPLKPQSRTPAKLFQTVRDRQASDEFTFLYRVAEGAACEAAHRGHRKIIAIHLRKQRNVCGCRASAISSYPLSSHRDVYNIFGVAGEPPPTSCKTWERGRRPSAM